MTGFLLLTSAMICINFTQFPFSSSEAFARNFEPNKIAIDPINPEIIFFVDSDGNLFRSDDGGSHWHDTRSKDVEWVVCEPGAPGKVWSNLGLSGDGGVTWTSTSDTKSFVMGVISRFRWTGPSLPTELRNENANFTPDSTNAQVFYAATNEGVYRTDNGGKTWQQRNAWLRNTDVATVTVDPRAPQTVYAASSDGIYISENAGGMWGDRSVEIAGRTYLFWSGSATGKQQLFGIHEGLEGPFYSQYPIVELVRIGKSNFEKVKLNEMVYSIGLSASNPLVMFVCLTKKFDVNVKPEGKLAKSTDGGNTWTYIEVKNQPVRWIVDDPQGNPVLLADRLGSKANASTDWESTEHHINDAVFEPSNSQIVFSATNNGVLISREGKLAGERRGENDTRFIEMDPTNSQVLYVLALENGESKILRSGDMGWSWQPVGSCSVTRSTCYLLDPTTPAIQYIGSWGKGVFKSTDGGVTWKSAGQATGDLPTLISGLAIDPTASKTLYATSWSKGKIYKTTDGCLTWTAIGEDLNFKYANAVTINPLSPQTIYLGAEFGKIYRSDDGGISWSPVSLPLTEDVVCLSLNPANPTTLYAGTFEGHIFQSSDSGQHWRCIAGGLGLKPPYLLAISRDGKSFAASTANEIWISTNRFFWEKTTYQAKKESPITLWVEGQNVLVGTPRDGLHLSRDMGKTWEQMKCTFNTVVYESEESVNYKITDVDLSRIPIFLRAAPLAGILVGEFFPELVGYRVDRFLSIGKLFYRDSWGYTRVARFDDHWLASDDYGTNWKKVKEVPWANEAKKLVDKSRDQVIKHLRNQYNLSKDDAPKSIKSMFMVSTNEVFASTKYGLYLIKDEKEVQEIPTIGLPSKTIVSAAMQPENSMSILVFVQNDGLWYTEDGGKNWIGL